MENFVSDELLGTFVPILVYWIYSGFYIMLGGFDNYRLHTRKDEDIKNLVSKATVVKGVLLQQAVQALIAILLFTVTSNSDTTDLQPSLIVLVRQFLIAMLILDTWQYFMHRYMHHNKFLYRHIHSQHHRLVVPYAFGALYNHPLEGLLLDTIGGALSFLLSVIEQEEEEKELGFTFKRQKSSTLAVTVLPQLQILGYDPISMWPLDEWFKLLNSLRLMQTHGFEIRMT